MSDINLIIRYDNGNLDVVTKQTENELENAGKKGGRKAGKSFSNEFQKYSKEAGDALSKGLNNALKVTTAISAAITAVGGATLFKGISAAITQEDAVNRLAGALKSSGDFSQAALKDFQSYASGLQQITKVGDETALNQLALAKSFGATNEQAKQIVTTAADLAQAFGTDIETQVRQISKTLGGFAGELGETQPKLKALSQEQLRNGEAINILSQAYAGQAANALNSFSGVTAQAGNALGDLFEDVGKLVTQNPAVIKAFKGLTDLFRQGSIEVQNFAKTFDIFDDLLIPLVDFQKGIITYVIAPLELLANVGNLVFNGLKSGIATITAGFGLVGQAVIGVLDLVGVEVEQSTKDNINNFADAAKQTAIDAAGDVASSFENIYDFTISDKLDQKNEELRAFLQEQKAIIQEETANTIAETGAGTVENVQILADQYTSIFSVFKDVAGNALTGVGQNFKDINKNIEQSNQVISDFTKKTGKAFQQGFAGAIGGAFAELGRALQSGDNALQAFGQAFLKAIGNTLIQQGTAFILEGTAYTFSANPELSAKGPGLIASGGAMAAFGGLLGASVSGGGAKGGGGGATTGGSTNFQDPVTGEFVGQLEGRAEPQTVLNINVEGNVVDQDAFTRRLVQQIGDEGGKQGLVFNNFAAV